MKTSRSERRQDPRSRYVHALVAAIFRCDPQFGRGTSGRPAARRAFERSQDRRGANGVQRGHVARATSAMGRGAPRIRAISQPAPSHLYDLQHRLLRARSRQVHPSTQAPGESSRRKRRARRNRDLCRRGKQRQEMPGQRSTSGSRAPRLPWNRLDASIAVDGRPLAVS